MWTFIIVLVAFIIIKFIYDTMKQSFRVKSEGGIRKKYSVLIDHLLNGHERCRILHDNNMFVSVGVIGPGGSQIYHITPAYGMVSIRMEIKNNPIFGNMKMEWTFPENMDQEDMIQNINQGLENKFSSMCDGIL